MCRRPQDADAAKRRCVRAAASPRPALSARRPPAFSGASRDPPWPRDAPSCPFSPGWERAPPDCAFLDQFAWSETTGVAEGVRTVCTVYPVSSGASPVWSRFLSCNAFRPSRRFSLFLGFGQPISLRPLPWIRIFRPRRSKILGNPRIAGKHVAISNAMPCVSASRHGNDAWLRRKLRFACSPVLSYNESVTCWGER